MANDSEVIKRVLGGDADAFRALVERYEGPLFRLVRNVIPDQHLCEDIAQDAFLSAFRHLKGFDANRASFSTWLFTIARNRCFSALRKKAPLPVEDLPEGELARTPLDHLAEKDLFEHLDRALDALPPDQKITFVLREFLGLSAVEISGIEGVDAGTVRSRLSRAKSALRSALGAFAGGDA